MKGEGRRVLRISAVSRADHRDLPRDWDLPRAREVRIDSAAEACGSLGVRQYRRGIGEARASEFRRYLDIARGSLAEVGYLPRLGRDREYLPTDTWQALDGLHNRTGFLLWRLYRSLEARD